MMKFKDVPATLNMYYKMSTQRPTAFILGVLPERVKNVALVLQEYICLSCHLEKNALPISQ